MNEYINNILTNIPGEMIKANRWCLWKNVDTKGKKPSKVPYIVDAATGNVVPMDKKIKSSMAYNNLKDLISFSEKSSSVYAFSFGFTFVDTDEFVFIDIDNCLDESSKIIIPEIQEFVNKYFPCAYIEYSPSRRGLHIYVRADKHQLLAAMGGKLQLINPNLGIELYLGKRFSTITGDVYADVGLGLMPILDFSFLDIFRLPGGAASGVPTGVTPQDPTTKDGWIGAFCRSYSIYDAIEMLGVYEPADGGGDRYRYIPSESGPGALVYDGMFLYSNHATDPACGVCCNAFDLVRIHLFGGDTQRMYRFCSENTRCVTEMNRKALPVDDACDGIASDEPEDVEDTSWKLGLKYNNKGQLVKNMGNIELILHNVFGIRYNVFDETLHITKRPWENKSEAEHFNSTTHLNNKDIAMIKSYIDRHYNVRNVNSLIVDCIDAVSVQNRFHPVKDYLANLPKWDGVERAERLFIDAYDCEDTPYARAVTRKMLSAMVQRVYKPGIKFDYMLTLVGTTGFKKSAIFRQLCGDEYFSDDFTLWDTRDKTGSEKMLGNWCVEVAELQGMKKADTECVKGFITRQYDKYRPAFGRVVETHPRSCVLVGTSNEESGLLKDITGGRRFWILKVRKKFEGEVDRDMVWAEVMERFREEKLYLDDELEAEANRIQSENIEADDRAEWIEDWMEGTVCDGWYDKPIGDRRVYWTDVRDDTVGKRREFITVKEIWYELYGKNLADLTRHESNRIVACLIKLGYRPLHTKTIKGYGRSLVYTRR
jgi:predicted P-loop ATPase